jgi:hypothetical protein
MILAATGHKISSVPSGKGAAAAHSRDSIFLRRGEEMNSSLFVIVTVSFLAVKEKMGKMTENSSLGWLYRSHPDDALNNRQRKIPPGVDSHYNRRDLDVEKGRQVLFKSGRDYPFLLSAFFWNLALSTRNRW